MRSPTAAGWTWRRFRRRPRFIRVPGSRRSPPPTDSRSAPAWRWMQRAPWRAASPTANWTTCVAIASWHCRLRTPATLWRVRRSTASPWAGELDVLPGMARRTLSEVASLTPARWSARETTSRPSLSVEALRNGSCGEDLSAGKPSAGWRPNHSRLPRHHSMVRWRPSRNPIRGCQPSKAAARPLSAERFNGPVGFAGKGWISVWRPR